MTQYKPLTFIQISDTHLMDRPDLNFVNINPAQSFEAIIQEIHQNYPQADALFHTGDLAQVATLETYQYYLDYMQQWSTPFFQVPGNHDHTDYFPFYNAENKTNIVHFGKWSVILLNSAVAGQTDGWISDQALAELDQLLQNFPQQHIILTCHHHPFEMKSNWIDQHKLKNSERLFEVLSHHQNLKIVLYGHVHQDSLNEWHGVSFYSTPATSVQFEPQSYDFALDDRAPGYRVLHLHDDGTFETKVVRSEAAYQKINPHISGY